MLKRGDAFLHNSPYHGCTHPADHSILVPVIDDDGVHRFTVLAKGHQADCGNALPTTYMGAAKDVYAEGALIFPAVKIQEDYEHVMDIVRMCRMRIRVPDQWWGDYLATLGAARVGEREILALGREVGWDLLAAYTKRVVRLQREADDRGRPRHAQGQGHADEHPRPVPRHAGRGRHDQGHRRGQAGRGDDRGRPPRQSRQHGERPQPLRRLRALGADGRRSSIRSTIPCRRTRAASAASRFISATAASPVGRIHPTSCSVATTNIADRVANPVQCAIAELADGLGMAETGAAIPPSIGVVSGVHDGKPFVNEVYLGCTGGAGTPSSDGWLTILHVGNAGMCYQDFDRDRRAPPPDLRAPAPALLPDTEGAGRFRGAVAAYSEFSPVGCEMTVAYVSDGNRQPGLGHARRPGRGSILAVPPARRRLARAGARLRRGA